MTRPPRTSNNEEVTSEKQLLQEIMEAVNRWYQRQHSQAVKQGIARRRQLEQDAAKGK